MRHSGCHHRPSALEGGRRNLSREPGTTGRLVKALIGHLEILAVGGSGRGSASRRPALASAVGRLHPAAAHAKVNQQSPAFEAVAALHLPVRLVCLFASALVPCSRRCICSTPPRRGLAPAPGCRTLLCMPLPPPHHGCTARRTRHLPPVARIRLTRPSPCKRKHRCQPCWLPTAIICNQSPASSPVHLLDLPR